MGVQGLGEYGTGRWLLHPTPGTEQRRIPLQILVHNPLPVGAPHRAMGRHYHFDVGQQGLQLRGRLRHDVGEGQQNVRVVRGGGPEDGHAACGNAPQQRVACAPPTPISVPPQATAYRSRRGGGGARGGNYNRSGCDPPPSYLSKLAGGGGGGAVGAPGGGGGVGGRAAGGGGGDWQLSRGEGLRATHYYHMHTSRVCVCVWGHGDVEVSMR